MNVTPLKVKLRSFQLRKPIVGHGLLYILQTKGCRDLVPCLFLNKNNEVEKGYLNKNWIAERTVVTLALTDEEVSVYEQMLALAATITD